MIGERAEEGRGAGHISGVINERADEARGVLSGFVVFSDDM